MMELKISRVAFDGERHTYSLDGKRLQGVTPIVKWVYPETYKDIPEAVLLKAAEHGTSVHRDCQLSDAGIPVMSREAEAYRRMKEENGKETLRNEWMVDDGKDIASSIDVVFADGSIADIKATSVIHRKNVTLQLSIYAWLLERMNPGLVVPDVYVIWLPRQQYGDPAFMKLDRIDAEVCEKVVGMYLDKEDNTRARALLGEDEVAERLPVSVDASVPMEFRKMEKSVADLEKEIKRLKSMSEQLRDGLLQKMIEKDIKKYEGEYLVLTRVDETVRTSIDSTKLKKNHPDIYEECKKVSKVKTSLKLTIKDNEQEQE